MEEDPPSSIRSIDEPGLKAEGDVLRGMRAEVARVLQRNQLNFPGAQPVSFSRKHIEELQREDYFLCEKSDGLRYLLYATEDQGNEIHYLIDRKNDYYYINNGNLHFPLPKDEQDFHRGTILDGELVVDTLPNGKTQFTFLVFDCLALDGQVLMNRDLSKRLGYFRENLFGPYKTLLAKYPQERDYQPFFVEMKDMQLPYGIEAMFKDMIPKLRHGNDGLIFTCIKSEYKPGTDQHILKWKDADENSIDFKWHLSWDKVEPDAIDRAEGITEPYEDWEAIPKVELYVYHGNGDYRPFAPMHLEESEWETLKGLGDPLNGRIVECYMDEDKRWRFSRFRDDKTDANHISTVNSVIDSIRDAVTKDDLIAAAPHIRHNWKERAARQQTR